jgi:hypothetical protein
MKTGHLLLLAGLLLSGCSGSKDKPDGGTPSKSSSTASANSDRIQLIDVAAEAGIDFELGHGGRSPLTVLETTPGGCAWIDFDADGWPDILLVGPDKVALYRNLGNGKFANVTTESGLRQPGNWMGCSSGDYDGDGLPDIFVSGYRCGALYRNLGKGKFQDVTASAGISGLEWSVSPAFADLNGDGKIDLFISQFFVFNEKTPQLCQVGNIKSACGPEIYQPLSGKLFINQGNGKFKSVPWKDTGKTWGSIVSDFFNTGKPALYLANDMMPGDMWVNEQGKWKNIGGDNATAYDAMGHLQGGMGVDAADYDNDGNIDLAVTTYFAQSDSIYHNDGDGLFTVVGGRIGLGPPTTPYVGFGVGWVDLDNDGWQDFVVTNGHVRDNVHEFDASQTYAQPTQVFRQQSGKFIDVTNTAGDTAKIKAVGRGLTFADYNHDGKMDVLICNLEGRAILLENRSTAGHWVEVNVRSKGANRDGLGARVTLTSASGKQIREIRTCGSVMSGREPLAHFGIGDLTGPVEITVALPGSPVIKKTLASVDQRITVEIPARP